MKYHSMQCSMIDIPENYVFLIENKKSQLASAFSKLYITLALKTSVFFDLLLNFTIFNPNNQYLVLQTKFSLGNDHLLCL